jgi:serine/threonine-protein kinase
MTEPLSSAAPTIPNLPSAEPAPTAAEPTKPQAATPAGIRTIVPPAAARAGAANAPAAATLPPAPSPRQLGRFSITRALRKERNSVVYLGADPVLHREVIIKAVQLPPPADATAHQDAQIDPIEQAFVRQAQAAGKLSHPHIVTVYEAGRVHETGYLAIERVNGRGLHELIASGWRPQFVHCASIAARIADAIEYAHQQSVAHGHLGPQHVMLQVDGAPKIEGFGGWIDGGSGGDDALAKTEKLLPYFHSELTDEERRRDVRAVAALVYMMLTGKAPGERPAPVTSLRGDVPAALARLVDEVLSPANGGSRRTAGDLRDALTGFIWNERRDNVAPATIGIPLAAPPRRAEPAAVRAPVSDAYAPTVAMDLAAPTAASPSAARPATLTLRPGTKTPVLAPELPAAPEVPASPTERLKDAWRQLVPWVQRNRVLVGGVAGLGVSALVIAAILAATAGSDRPTTASAALSTKAAAAVPTGNGIIRLDIAPWGEVFVDGKPIGVSPPMEELRLPAGRHTVEIRYADKAAVTAQLDVDPAKALQIRHRFE